LNILLTPDYFFPHLSFSLLFKRKVLAWVLGFATLTVIFSLCRFVLKYLQLVPFGSFGRIQS
jgi:hypothetical protein